MPNSLSRSCAIFLSVTLLLGLGTGQKAQATGSEAAVAAIAWLGKKIVDQVGNKIYDKTAGKVIKDVFVVIFSEDPDPLREAVSIVVAEIKAVRADMHDLFTQDVIDAARGLEYSLDELLDLIMLEQSVDIELALILRDAADVRASLEGIILHGISDLEQQTFDDDLYGEDEYRIHSSVRVARAYNSLMPVIAFLRLIKGHSTDLVEEPYYELLRVNRVLINYRRCFSSDDISCEGPLLRIFACKFNKYYTMFGETHEDYAAVMQDEAFVWAASRVASDFVRKRTSGSSLAWYSIGSHFSLYSGETVSERYCLSGILLGGEWFTRFSSDFCDVQKRESAWTVRHFSSDRIQVVHGASGLCLAIGDNGGSYVKLRSCEYGDSWHVNHFASIFSLDPSNLKAIDTHEFTLISGEHDDKPLFKLFGCQPEDVATIRPLTILGGSVDPELPSWPAMAGANVNICGDGFSALNDRWWFNSEPSDYPGDPRFDPALLPVLTMMLH